MPREIDYFDYDIIVEGNGPHDVRVTGSMLDARTFSEVEGRLMVRYKLIRGSITHKPRNSGESTRYFDWRRAAGTLPPAKPRVRLPGVVDVEEPKQIILPALPAPHRPTHQPYVSPEIVSFLAKVAGLTTINEEDVYAEKVEPYTYKARLTNKEMAKEARAIERAANAAAVRTAN